MIRAGESAASVSLAVEYSFDMGVLLDELKSVLVMADNYCLFKGNKGKNIDFLIEYEIFISSIPSSFPRLRLYSFSDELFQCSCTPIFWADLPFPS